MSFDSHSTGAYSVINDITRRHYRAFRGAGGLGPDRRQARPQPQPARRWEIDNLSPIPTIPKEVQRHTTQTRTNSDSKTTVRRAIPERVKEG